MFCEQRDRSESPVSALGVAVSFVTVNNHLGFLYPPVLFAWVDPTNRRLSLPNHSLLLPSAMASYGQPSAPDFLYKIASQRGIDPPVFRFARS